MATLMTNNEFSKKNEVFKKACLLANIPTSSRQASKFRRNKGLAYDQRYEASKRTNEEARKEAMANQEVVTTAVQGGGS